MEFKDLYMWEQDVYSTGKRFMVMDLLQCPLYPRILHPAAPVAAPPRRSPLKTPQNFTVMQNGKIWMLPSLTSQRLRVSGIFPGNQNYANVQFVEFLTSGTWFDFLSQIMMTMRGQC